MESNEITTLTLFTFSPGGRLWPFVAMATAGRRLKKISGLHFHKMMGAGEGIGFSARPDFGRYALLGTWESREDAERFLKDSTFIADYRARASRLQTWFLRPERSHGSWDGSDPFADAVRPQVVESEPVAVMTRATINLSRARRFWKMVAPVSAELEVAEGLISSIGVGEAPWIRQATFSVWESEEAMKRFAYGAPRHREVIARTRREGWYSEDLFVRFAILEERVEELRS